MFRAVRQERELVYLDGSRIRGERIETVIRMVIWQYPAPSHALPAREPNGRLSVVLLVAKDELRICLSKTRLWRKHSLTFWGSGNIAMGF